MKTLIAVCLSLLFATTAIAADKPLKVFILAGQSNMQGHAHISTLDYLGDDPASASLLQEIRNADGSMKVHEDIWISSVGAAGDGWSDVIEQKGQLRAGFGASEEKLGPELTFGITMSQTLGEPILLIKTAWGGRSLISDFRPPGAGPRVFSDYIKEQWSERGVNPVAEAERHNRELNGVFYRHMIEHVKMVLADIPRVMPGYDPAQGYELAGFVWFQGFNDLVDGWSYPQRDQPGGYDEYAELLAHLVRDVRKDLSAPDMPFVIGVMGIGGESANDEAAQQNFRAAQASVAALPEFEGNVFAVPTAPYWSEELGAIDKKHERVSQMRYFLESQHKAHANADGSMSNEEISAYLEKFQAEVISEEEAALWERGASNAAYHYLGCGKTMALIGKAFAEAILNRK